jgi:hypothetical protein
VKSSIALTGHAAADALSADENKGVGGVRDAGGDGAAWQPLSDVSADTDTPAAIIAFACALMQAPSVTPSEDATPATMKGVANAVMHAVQAFALSAQGATAALKSCASDTGQVAGGGGGDGLGGGGGLAHELSAVSAAMGTPAAIIAPACAPTHAPIMAASAWSTPAITNGVASAAMHDVHAFATLVHGVTAAEKS